MIRQVFLMIRWMQRQSNQSIDYNSTKSIYRVY